MVCLIFSFSYYKFPHLRCNLLSLSHIFFFFNWNHLLRMDFLLHFHSDWLLEYFFLCWIVPWILLPWFSRGCPFGVFLLPVILLLLCHLPYPLGFLARSLGPGTFHSTVLRPVLWTWLPIRITWWDFKILTPMLHPRPIKSLSGGTQALEIFPFHFFPLHYKLHTTKCTDLWYHLADEYTCVPHRLPTVTTVLLLLHNIKHFCCPRKFPQVPVQSVLTPLPPNGNHCFDFYHHGLVFPILEVPMNRPIEYTTFVSGFPHLT